MSLIPSRIIGAMSRARFFDVMSRSPRQVRETLFNRLHIKADGRKTIIPRPHQKNEERLQKLHGRLAECPATAKNEQELCEELIRNWLMTRRPMLAAAMDLFEVKHDQGLTEQDLDFLEKLEAGKVKSLVESLLQKFEPEEVAIYLRVQKIPHLHGLLPRSCYPTDAPAPLTEEPAPAPPAAEAAPSP